MNVYEKMLDNMKINNILPALPHSTLTDNKTAST